MYANPAQWAAGGGWQNHFTNQAGEGKFAVTNVLYLECVFERFFFFVFCEIFAFIALVLHDRVLIYRCLQFQTLYSIKFLI